VVRAVTPAAASVTAPATAPARATAPAAAPVAITPVAPAANVSAAPAPRPQPDANGISGAEAGLLALLAAGGLAGAGIMVARSRRKRDDDEIAEADLGRADTFSPEPVQTPEPVALRQPEPAGEPFAMPAGEVPSGAEREALLEQMVHAAPDEVNPVTSPRSRRKRARLILQHRAHLQEAEGGEPFDWRTYRSAETESRVKEPPVPA
jgi:hypothetical protein